MRTRSFSPGNNAPVLHLTRDSNVVKTYTDSGKGPFVSHSSQTFPTVTAAKAFMANPRY